MPSKKALEQAYDAGQAAQLIGAPNWGNPFDAHRQEERDEWFRGKTEPLADKWKPGGQDLFLDIDEKITLNDRAEA